MEPLKLFQELIRLGQAGALDGAPGYSSTRLSQWQSTRDTVLAWLLGPNGPIATQNWTQYFEDVGSDATNNLNQLVPGETAKFLMDNPALDPSWQAHVQNIIAFIETNFGDTLEYGARPIKEQYAFHYKMGSHTARYAAVNARYAELTGDAAAKDKAFRAFNWATYMVRNSGLTIDGPYPNNVWFTDGWGDFIRHFVIGMGAQPDWAPAGQNHLLRSTSVVKSITYGPGNEVRYTTYDASATEVLRLAFVPSSVTAGGTALAQRTDLAADGWTFDTGNNALRIRHSTSGVIVISGAPPTAPSVAITTPTSGQNFTAPATPSLGATATASTGRTLASVTFRAGATVLCTVSAPTTTSVSCGVSSLQDGAHSVTAKATDDTLQTTTSAAVPLTLSNPPTVSLTSPAANATYTAPASVPLAATASAGHGRGIARVDFYADGTSLLCSSTTSPYGCTWSNPSQGSHTVRAVAVDTGNPAASTSSATVSITVSSAAPTALVGNTTVLTTSDFEHAGVAAAFNYVASATGNVTRLYIYVDGQTAATSLQLGLYANGSGTPGALLRSCTVAPVAPGAWNVCTITSQAVSSGTTYWLAVLSPTGGGDIYWRQTSGTGSYKVQPGLATLPSTWSGTGGYPGSNMSAYAGN
ncbi:hypothetical protein JY651_18000 [Pyxidicoccus parkwayensis]|uniref:Bacterial Ig-like domain-containing protein n=1 Tax=Pyxidicoccus parkwayensis TaxID=2813578 RepID=A0ABX7P883_9BACT|nr:Ig-like domain-containing protein [Pyxidicoccus parkwaysis]QSQ26704.1 hypothetical protein JY651_18000 [Pyxidicoccus parkwaysis]